MPARIPLPDRLHDRPFTLSDGRESGLGRRRMLGGDLSRPFRAVRQSPSPDTVEALCRAYAVRMPRGAVFCLATAAVLLGIPLPRALEALGPVHVAVPASTRAPRARGVIGHRFDLEHTERATRRGLPVTSPARTWCDLAAVLDLADLVAAGDHLIHRGRRLVTLSTLTSVVGSAAGRRGALLLREALPLLDERSESRRESHLRLILLGGGIDGIEPNFWIVLAERLRYRVDFAIPHLKVAIEYQGDYHRDPVQWRADMTRISRLEAHGWIVILVNADDLHDPLELVARIDLVLAARRQGVR